MNLHDNEFDPSLQELEAQLSQWKVAPPTIDPQVVFYQAGFAAANAQNQTRVWNQRLVMAASLLLAIGFSSLISYRAGQSSAIGELNQIAAKAPSQLEPSDAVVSDRSKDDTSGDMANATANKVEERASVPVQSLVVRLPNQWLQSKFTFGSSHNRDLLAAADPSRQFNKQTRGTDSRSISEPVDLYEQIDTPEYALLKRERALRSQRLINWLPTL